MYRMLRAKNSGLKKDVVAFAQELIREESVSGNEKNVADLIEREMVKGGYDKVFKDEAGNVIGVIFGRENGPNVLLVSHMDTVETEEENWSLNPLAGEIKENKLYGLGATDCKSGIAAQVYSGILLKRSILPLRGNIIVAATVSERNGLSIGTRYLFEKTLPDLGFKVDIAILGEPTDLGIYYGHNGWLEVKINVESCNLFNVTDALDIIGEQLLPYYSGDRVYRFSAPVINNIDTGYRGELSYVLQINKENADTVINNLNKKAVSITKPIGKVITQVSLKREEHLLYTGKKVLTNYISNAWEINPYNPVVERVKQALEAGGEEVLFNKWQLNQVEMATSGNVIVNEFKIPAIGYGPGLPEKAHTIDEFVEIEKITQAVYGTALIAHGICGIPVCGWTLDEI